MKRYIYNETAFTNSDEISYYLLGAYLTDGCIYNTTFELTSKDTDWLETIRDIIVPSRQLGWQRNCSRLRGSNVIISNWLRMNKCIPKKSLIVEFPIIPENYLPDLIRGLIDGDGSISTTRNTVFLCSASTLFIKSFCDILDMKGIKYNFYERKSINTKFKSKTYIRNSSLYKISIYGKNCYKFLKWIYYSNDVICMPRKQKLSNTIIECFEKRGLNIHNIDRFNSNQNRSKYKISNNDLANVLYKWRSLPMNIQNTIGSRKQFYLDNIDGKYDITYHYMNRLINGNQRKTQIYKLA
jgi:LAGLIDADG-like domain